MRRRAGRRAGRRNGAQLEVADALLRIEGHLKEETERVQLYLDASTRKPLIDVVEQTLLTAHTMAIIERGFDTLMVGGLATAREK